MAPMPTRFLPTWVLRRHNAASSDAEQLKVYLTLFLTTIEKREGRQNILAAARADVQFTIHLFRDKLVSSQASSYIVPGGTKQIGNKQKQ